VLLIHGGGTVSVNLAGVMAALVPGFRCVAPDRPGCGLTDSFDHTNVPFRPHAINFGRSILDALNLQKAALIGNSMGGLWSLYFALAMPDRVTKIALLGGGQRASAAKKSAMTTLPKRRYGRANSEKTPVVFLGRLTAASGVDPCSLPKTTC
jgi:pimeloyl-ACP methyl ester carboxylesterase